MTASPPTLAADLRHLQAWKAVQRLLVVRLDNLGDLLMTTPAIAALREGLPDAHITLLTSPSGAALGPHLTMVNEVVAWHAPWVKNDAAISPTADLLRVQELAEGRYDAAVIFTVCTQSALPAALLTWLAGIPLRLAHCRENPYALLSDWVPEPDIDLAHARHEVQRQLDLVGTVGFTTADQRLRFALHAEDVRSVGAQLRNAGIDAERPLVVVHPGATAESRRWPAERFGVAARDVARATGAAVALTGSAAESACIDRAHAELDEPAAIFAGTLSLGEMGALVARAAVLLSNNSGPVHLAAALGTPVVDLYALTNPQHTPWRVRAHVLNHDVPCRHCLKSVCPQGHHACLRGVAAADATSAAIDLMRPPAVPEVHP
jgi:lipopolysaccharide heptosyltransferase II